MITDAQKEAQLKIKELLQNVKDKLDEATAIANEAGVDFYWDGPAYGMGGYYNPTPDRWGDSSETGWQASSQSC